MVQAMLLATWAASAVDVACEAPRDRAPPACPICQQPEGDHSSPPLLKRRFIRPAYDARGLWCPRSPRALNMDDVLFWLAPIAAIAFIVWLVRFTRPPRARYRRRIR